MLYLPPSHSGSLPGVLKCLWSTPCCAFYAWSKGDHYGSYQHSSSGRMPSSPWAWWCTASGRIASHLSDAVAAPHQGTPTNIKTYFNITCITNLEYHSLYYQEISMGILLMSQRSRIRFLPWAVGWKAPCGGWVMQSQMVEVQGSGTWGRQKWSIGWTQLARFSVKMKHSKSQAMNTT